MKKNKYFFFICGIVCTLFSQNIYAMNTQPVPSKNPLLVKTATKEQTIKDIPAYFYNNSNYFMLRDIGKF